MLRKIIFPGTKAVLIGVLFLCAFLYPAEKITKSHYEKALDLYKNRDVWLGAVSEARMHLEEYPTHIKSYILIANIYYEIKEYPKAAETMLAAVEKEAYNQESIILMNKIMLAWQKSNNSQEQLVSYYVEIARVFSRHQYYAKAIEYYQKYLRVKPADSKVRLEYARVLSWAKYYGSSIDEYNIYLSKHPQETKIILELAYVHYWKNNLLLAETELNKILLVDPNNIEVYLLLGVISEQKGKYEKARGVYDKILKISQDNKKALDGLDRIKALELRAQLSRTPEGMRQAIEVTKDYTLYLTIANQLYYEEGLEDGKKADHREEAFKYYRLYFDKFPEDYESKAKFAEILSWEKHYEESASLYREYLNKYPEENMVRLELAKVLVWKGELPAALKELEKVESLDSSLSDIYLTRGNIYREQNDYKKALECYKQVLALPYNLYNQEVIENILEVEKTLGIGTRAMPALYLLYSNLYESTYGFRQTGYDLGGRVNIINGTLTLSAGYRQYQLDQPNAPSAQAKEIYLSAEGMLQENWKGSVGITGVQMYTYPERVSLTLGTEAQLSPETSIMANYYNRDGILETQNLNTLLPVVAPAVALTEPLNVDNFVFQINHKLSEENEISGYLSEGYFSDNNTREMASAEFLHKISETPLVKIGGGLQYLAFRRQEPALYWTPDPSYSTISFIATLDNNVDNVLIYRAKAEVSRVLENPQIEINLEGDASYYISKNLSAELAVSYGRGSAEVTSSIITNILVGITYHFEN